MRLFFYLMLPVFYAIIGNYIKVDEVELKQAKIEYGNILKDNDSDGYIKIIDEKDGELIKEVFYDSNANDYFKYLAITSYNTFLVVCDSFYFNEEYTMPIYRDSVVLKYNLDGDLLDRKFLDFRPSDYFNHNFLLILNNSNDCVIIDNNLENVESIQDSYTVKAAFDYQYQGLAYVNGLFVENLNINYPGYYSVKIIDNNYSFELFVTVEADYKILGQKYVEGYVGEVSFFSFGELFLNGETYNIGSTINTVGNHHMVVVGINDYREDIYFTILPDISYNDGEVEGQLLLESNFNSPIRIYSDAQSMLLNGLFYNSEIINDVGTHKIEFFGINGYSLELYFNILPSVSGLENNNTYENISFFVFGDATLNGETITGEIELHEPGQYELKLMFNGEVYDTFNFQILGQDIIEEEVESDFSEYFKYIFVLITLIGGVLILRKK